MADEKKTAENEAAEERLPLRPRRKNGEDNNQKRTCRKISKRQPLIRRKKE